MRSGSDGASAPSESRAAASNAGSDAGGTAKPAKRRKAPVKKDEDWEEDWEKEDVAEQERAKNPTRSVLGGSGGTSNLLEELQRLLSKQNDALNARASKKSKKEKKGKRSKARAEGQDEESISEAEGSTAEERTDDPSTGTKSTTASKSGKADEDDIVIEDVD